MRAKRLSEYTATYRRKHPYPAYDAIGAPASVPWAFVDTNPASMLPADLLCAPSEMRFDFAVFGVLWLPRDRAWIIRRPGTLCEPGARGAGAVWRTACCAVYS